MGLKNDTGDVANGGDRRMGRSRAPSLLTFFILVAYALLVVISLSLLQLRLTDPLPLGLPQSPDFQAYQKTFLRIVLFGVGPLAGILYGFVCSIPMFLLVLLRPQPRRPSLVMLRLAACAAAGLFIMDRHWVHRIRDMTLDTPRSDLYYPFIEGLLAPAALILVVWGVVALVLEARSDKRHPDRRALSIDTFEATPTRAFSTTVLVVCTLMVTASLSAWGLGRLSDARQRAAIRRLREGGTSTRIESVLALERRDARVLKPLLGALLTDESPRVRSAAAGVLAGLAGLDAADRMVEGLEDPDPGVRGAVLSALDAVRLRIELDEARRNDWADAVAPLMETDPALRREAADLLIALAPTNTDSVTRYLHREGELFALALEVLGHIGDEDSMYTVLDHYRLPAARIALEALVRRHGVASFLEYVFARDAPDFRLTRDLVVRIIRDQGDAAVASLREAAGDIHKNTSAREFAFRMLEELAGADAAEAMARRIVRELSHEDPSVRRNAGYIIPDLGRHAVEPLIGMLEQEDQDVREEAASLLRRITGMGLGLDAERWRAWWKEHRGERTS